MICCTVPKSRPRPDAVSRSVTHMSVRLCAISSTRAGLTSVIQALLCPLRLTSVTLSLPDAKMLSHSSTRCLDVTSVPYTSERCRCLSAGTLSTRTKRVTPTYKRDQFSKWATELNCRSCASSTRVPRITWPSTLELCVIYSISTVFEILTCLAPLIGRLAISLIHPLKNVIILSAFYSSVNSLLVCGPTERQYINSTSRFRW
jgi:hypothetical protein